jgi:uncharacterized Tic20 family protein
MMSEPDSDPAESVAQLSAESRARSNEVLPVLAYLSTLVTWIVGPLLIYVTSRRKSAIIREHSAQAMNLAFTYSVYVILIAWLVGSEMVFVLLFGAVNIGSVLYLIIATAYAARGRSYRIPKLFCFPLVR